MGKRHLHRLEALRRDGPLMITLVVRTLRREQPVIWRPSPKTRYQSEEAEEGEEDAKAKARVKTTDKTLTVVIALVSFI